ncbi:response regulator [Paraburkholderia sp. EG286B]|uniref:response regulator n=1 Tax=Paraburkholderia sp. EG286B TaxID=3237011 RepID=UPI0034D18281
MTRVLLVDDDTSKRDALGAVLDVAGYEIVAARNGRDALGILPGARPRGIVSDVTMPFIDGVEMVRRIRAIPEFEQMPVIPMSAHATVPVQCCGAHAVAARTSFRNVDTRIPSA